MTKLTFSAADHILYIWGRYLTAGLLILLCVFFSYSSAIAQGEPSDPPIAIAGPDIFTEFGATVRLDGSGSISPDGIPLSYVWTETATGTVIGTGPVIAYTVIDGGFVDLTLSVSYSGGAVVTDDLTVSTQSVTPIANAGLDRTVVVGETIRLDGSDSQDQTGAKLSYVWTLVEAPEGSTATLNDPNAIRPAFTPDLDGLYSFDLNVANENGRLSEPARLTLSTANSSPAAFAGPDRLANIGEVTFFDPQGTIDPDGDALIAEWTLIHAPAGSGANLVETDGGRFALMPDVAGAYVAQLEISDSIGTSYDHAVLIVGAAGAINVPPTADAGQDISLIGNAPILLDGSQSSDMDGDRLDYSWAILSAPVGGQAMLSDADQPAATLTPSGAGTYVVQLTVKDDFGGVDRDIVLVTSDNQPAVALPGDDAAIIDNKTIVDSQPSMALNEVNTVYKWSALGFMASEATVSTPDQLITHVEYETRIPGLLNDPEVLAGLEVLQAYSLFTSEDHVAQASVHGRAAIGGKSQGGYSNYGSGLGNTIGKEVLLVANRIHGGVREIHGGGNIRVGKEVRGKTRIDSAGEIIVDAALDFNVEAQAIRKFSDELSNLSVTSHYTKSGSRSQQRVLLTAVPNDLGVATFHFTSDQMDLFDKTTNEIYLDSDEANTIVINVGGDVIDIKNIAFGGDFLNSNITQHIIWNFYEARLLKIHESVFGSILAPYSKTNMHADVSGSVAVKSLVQQADITLPNFEGDRLASYEIENPVSLTLMQLAASNDSGFSPDYATTLVTTGNLRPVGVLTSSTPKGGSLAPGDTVLFDSALSRDDGQAALQRQWSILHAPAGAVLPEGEALSAVSLELTPELSGNYIVQLLVSDGELTSKPVTSRFQIENEPPIANAGEDQNSLKGNLVAFDGTSSSDPEGNALSYAWTIASAPEGSTATLVNADTATPSFTPEIPGVYEVSLKVSDGVLESEADIVSVIIENQAPVAVATGMADGFAGDVIMVSGQQSTDADGDALTYSWSVSGPEGSTAQFPDPFTVAPSFVPDLGGVYTLSLVVFDGFAESEPATLVVNISDANRPPVLDAVGDKSVALGSTLSLALSASDPDGDQVYYAASPLPLPSGAKFDVNTGVLQFTPTSLSPNNFSLNVSASDGSLSDRETFSISVTNENVSTTTDYTGRVVDANTGVPVSGVLVMVGAQTALTDGNGVFTLTNLEPGQNAVWIVAGAQTDPDANGQTYGSTQISINLIENVLNAAANDIGLTPISALSQAVPGQPVTVENDAIGVSLSIPADGVPGEAITSRYWRILVNGVVSPSEPVSLAEFEIRGVSNGANLLVDGASSSSSTFSSTFVPSNAFDGNTSTGWASTDGVSVGEWIAYDLGEGNEISATEISITARGTTRGVLQAPTDFDLQVSQDGVNWTTVKNYQTSPDWTALESRNFEASEPYQGSVGIRAISAAQANTLPPNIVPCQMFSLEPKTVRFSKPVTLTVDNYDELPAGTNVDVWVFDGVSFSIVGEGTVSSDGDDVVASLTNIQGGQLIALAPKSNRVEITRDQPMGIYNPGLLNEGNFGTSYTVPSYSSLGADRAVTFVYNSTAADPQPIISSVTSLTSGNAEPQSISQVIKVGDATLSLQSDINLETSPSGTSAYVQSGTFDASALSSGTYPAKFISVSQYACSRVGTEVETDITISNQANSSIGSGWSIAEISRLEFGEDGSVSIINGNGSLLDFSPEQELGSVRETFAADVVGDNLPSVTDFNGDGVLDIIASDSARSSIRFYVGQAGGTNFIEDPSSEVILGNPVVVPPRPSGGRTDLSISRLGDFNTDGTPEVAVVGRSRDTLYILSRGENGYEVSQEIPHADDAVELFAADMDGDGSSDLVTYDDSRIRFFINDGTGILTEAPSQSRSGIDIAVEDIDGDGLADVIVLEGRRARIRFNEGNLTFREVSVTLPRSANRFYGQLVQVGDADLDGDNDLVVSTLPNITYIENLGDRSFRTVELPQPTGFTDPDNITLADVTGDGLLDIIADERTPQPRYSLFKKLVDGDYAPAESVVFGHPIGESLVQDIDGDGFQDLLSKSRFQLYVDYGQNPETGGFNSPFGDFSSLIRNADGTYSRRFTNGSVVTYNALGLQTASSDRNGNETQYVYDADGRLVSVTDPTGLVTTLSYGGDGKLDTVRDPAGKISTFTHNAVGNLIEIRDPEDQPTRYDYDDQRRMTSKTNKRDLTTINSYGAGGRYTGSEYADGTEMGLSVARALGLPDLGSDTSQFVAVEDRVSEVTDGRGNLTLTEVNEFGSIIRVVDALGRETIYERNPSNLVTAIIAPSSVTPSGTLRTELTYDVRGNVTSQTEAVGTPQERSTFTEYEPVFSRPTKLIDADGFETVMEYDAFGNRTRMIDPEGGEMTYVYNERGQIVSSTDKNENLTEFEYDNFGRLLFITDASGIRQQMVRDEAGNVVEMIDDVDGPEERRSLYSFDNLNREVSMTAADGGVTTYEYDGNDNVTSTTDPTGIVETRSYDERDRLETINDPASGTTFFTYDEDSNILRMTDALGETTEFTYDAVDRLLSSIDAKGQLRAFAYDSRDNITAVTDARANMTMMGYDALDRPVARTNPKGEQWNFAYDARDNRTSATKPDGVVLTSDYDALSRLTRIAGGDIERSYSYDAQSNLLAANDNLNGVAGPDLGFTYDVENRLATASVTNLFGGGAQNNVFTYGYDALDRRASMSDRFGGNTAYAYDPVDRLTRITTPQNEVFTQSYDLAGRMLGRIAPNSTVTDRSYEDGTGRLMSQTQAASNTAFNGFTYDYTDRGNIAEIAETGTLARTKRYSYDELERLTEVDVPEAPTEDESYTLDPEGNRITSQLSANHETDVANRLTGDDAYSYIYDLNGNLISKTAKPGVNRPDWTYDYDDLDQLISVSRDGIEVERYRYDAFGRRSVIETANDNAVFERTAIVNDGSDRTIDLVQDGAGVTQIQNRYTHGGQVDEPLSLEVFASDGSLDQSYTYHADHLGSIRFVTDSVGTIVNAYEYDSYGRPGFELEQVAQPFRYTGREWDQATELYHYRARQYDPETGRFLQEDPIGMIVGLEISTRHTYPRIDPDSIIGALDNEPLLSGGPDFNLSLYRYVNNDPINLIDPTGLIGISFSKLAQGSKKRALTLTQKLRALTNSQRVIGHTTRNISNGRITGGSAAQKAAAAKARKRYLECVADQFTNFTAEGGLLGVVAVAITCAPYLATG